MHDRYDVHVYDSSDADKWIEDNYSDPFLAAIRSTGSRCIGGPIACMLSHTTTALCLFVDLSRAAIFIAGHLAHLSRFPVIIKPLSEDPSAHTLYVL
jgi:hypothetical protein